MIDCNIIYLSGIQGEIEKKKILSSNNCIVSEGVEYERNLSKFIEHVLEVINPKDGLNTKNIDGFIDIMGDSGMRQTTSDCYFWIIEGLSILKKNSDIYIDFIGTIHAISSRRPTNLKILLLG